jgi:hypothetical protein
MASDYHGPERRQAPRVGTELYGSVQNGGQPELRCRVVNVSGVGACAVSSKPLAEMAMVRLRLAVRDDDAGELRSIDVEAAVVRCQRRADGAYDVGLFFTKVRAEDAAVLQMVVDLHSPAPAAG